MSNPYRDYRGMVYAAGIGFWEDGSLSPAIERFAALVAAAEREAIMEICNRHTEPIAGVIHHAIRARGNT